MMSLLEEGDTIFVTDLTRITRSTRDLFELVDEIKKKVNLKSLKDTWLDLSDDNPYSSFLMTVMGGVNQLERDLIRMRQREGINLAKKEGKYKGRVKKYHGKHAGINFAAKLYNEGEMTVNEICEITAVSRSALFRRLRELRERGSIQNRVSTLFLKGHVKKNFYPTIVWNGLDPALQE